MAQEGSDTPEKQLLRLIEDPKAESKKAFQAHTFRHRSLSLFSFGALKGRVSFFRDGFRHRFSGRLKGQSFIALDIKAINNILALCVFILGFYFIADFSLSLINLKKLPNLKFEIPKGSLSVNPQDVSLLKRASYYLEKTRTRNIFKMGAGKAIMKNTAAAPVVEEPTAKIIEATQHLRLVGISWSNDPDAMIEDVKALRTFFIKRGHMIGKVRVEAIFEDKVVLSYAGEEIELK